MCPPADEWMNQCGLALQWNIIQPCKGMRDSEAWATTCMNLENIIMSESSQTQKEILYDSMCMKYLEQTNSWQQKVD